MWLLLHFVPAALAVLHLLSQRFPRVTFMGWFVAVVFLWYLGPLSYTLFCIRRFAIRRGINKERHSTTCAGSVYLPINNDDLSSVHLVTGGEMRDSVLNAIASAKSEVLVATYIFTGKFAEEIISALESAAARGVEVCVIVDRIGSGLFFFKKWYKRLRASSLDIVFFKETGLLSRIYYVNSRLHSKILCVDGEFALVGSHNLRDAVVLADGQKEVKVRNTTVAVKGPIAGCVRQAFDEIYYAALGRHYLKDIDKHSGNSDAKPASSGQGSVHNLFYSANSKPDASDGSSNGFVRVLARDNRLLGLNSFSYFLSKILAAKKRIYIWTPYFVPPESVRLALMIALGNGIDVQIVTPIKADDALVTLARVNFLYEMAFAGAKVFYSTGTFEHSKVSIIDDSVVIGSSNFDYRSFFLNNEVNLEFLECAPLQSAILAEFERHKNLDVKEQIKSISVKDRVLSNICMAIVTVY